MTRLYVDGVLRGNYNAYRRDGANPRQDKYSLFQEGTPHYASEFDPAIDSGSAQDVLVRYDASYFDRFEDRRSQYLGSKGVLTHQFSASNTLTSGFDFQYHTLRLFQNLSPTDPSGFQINNVNYYGFDSLGNVADPSGYQNSTKHPYNLGLFLQDRLEHRGLIIQAGLRFDVFDYRSQRLKDIHKPFDPAGSDTAHITILDPTDLTSSKKFTRLSPRLGISFPISDKTQMHVNYGIFYQRPDLTNLYSGWNFVYGRIGGGSYYPQPSPNLGPETITQYEVGMSHQLGDFTAVDITAYYKDVKDLTQIISIPAFPLEWWSYGNADFGTIKGVDFSLTMRQTHNISMSLKYSLSYAQGTGSYSQSQYNIAWKNPTGTPRVTNPLDYDQRHSLIGMFDIRTGAKEGPRFGDAHPLENTGLNILIQAASGTPFTPMQPYDAITAAAVQQIPTGPINSAHLPWTFTVDMKLERTFTLGAYKLVPYLWVKNLLNYENVIAVYEGTGEPYSTGWLETPTGANDVDRTDPGIAHIAGNYGEQYSYRYDLLQNNPTNYSNPRMIIAGLRMSF